MKIEKSTKIIARIGSDDWAAIEVGSIAAGVPFKVYVWNGSTTKIATATVSHTPASEIASEVFKVTVSGNKIRCAPDCSWPVVSRHGDVRLETHVLKSGQRLVAHPRVGVDSLENLPGYTLPGDAVIAQVKFAREKVEMSSISVQDSLPILLENGVFCG